MSRAEAERLVVEVRSARRLSPSLVRVELGGPDLDGFVSLGAPDEGCVFHFPNAAGEELGRWYTVRRIAPSSTGGPCLTVDLVVHQGGVGGEWAAVARPGDELVISHRNSWYARPATAAWQLLLGDVTGLPAIGRIVEETAALVPTTVVLEVPDPADAQPLPGAEVTWVHTPHLAVTGSDLERHARSAVLPDGPGYVYAAGEAAAMRAVRTYLRHEMGWPTGTFGVIGYWRVDGERWRKRFEESGVDTAELYAQAEAEAADPEEVRDRYEQKLAAVGLL